MHRLTEEPFPGFFPYRLIALAVIAAGLWTAVDSEPEGPHGDLTPFLLAFAVVLLAAKIGGELFQRLGQPTVLGELVLGVFLGNLGLVGIGAADALREAPFMAVAGEIGVILLLFEVGLSCDLDDLVAVGRTAVLVAFIGVAAPLGLGFAASALFLPEDVQWYVHLFVGATLAATSVGITARVLKDLGQIETRESKIVLGAAVVDDILGLVILAFMLGLVRSADAGAELEFELLPIVLIGLKALAFLFGAVLMSRSVIMPVVALIEHAKSKSVGRVLAVAYCFVMAGLAELVGLADIVGAFAAGLVIDRALTKHFGDKQPLLRVQESIAPLSAVFVPVFFVYMGMRVEASLFAFPEVLAFTALLSAVAVASKMACALGVTDKGVNRLAVGVSMIPRGEVGLIFAGMGATAMVSDAPLFSDQTYSTVVAMVMVTTLVAPPLIARVYPKADQAASKAPAG